MFSIEFRNFSKRRSCARSEFGAFEVGEGDCLTAKVGFFGSLFVTPEGGLEASDMGDRLWLPVDVKEQALAHQAQDQTGVPLPPPPPPVNYGTLMQGLVHAMQTQSKTIAALQAQVQVQECVDVWWSSVLRTQFGDGAIEVAWAEFVRLFRAKYILEHVQDRME
ncbi:hypothetical protein Taro_053912 [Colocasia esculenta]|uniref:Uncharacterized protein n=1 Tax=Colocasia esculenta TaxID=4460 RepID=A0A843XNY4_COLES|nr:hypothetical protein [Colocasia esculenta]